MTWIFIKTDPMTSPGRVDVTHRATFGIRYLNIDLVDVPAFAVLDIMSGAHLGK